MRFSSARHHNGANEEENPYWISFSDIMAGLLVIFILAVVALVLELTQKSAEWDEAIAEAERVRKNIITEIQQELANKNIRVEIVDNDTVLRIPDDVLTFEQGSYELAQDEERLMIVGEIGRTLYSAITRDNRWQFLDTIFVEGHSDSTQNPNEALKGNWGLSAFRAISVWQYWTQERYQNIRLDDLRNHDGRNLFSVSGYAETRYVPCTNGDPAVSDPAACPQGRMDDEVSHQRNRRIDIRFTVRRPAMEDYDVLEGRVSNAGI